ncbi:MAG: EAL domain-containing protein [Solirubrobacterales bacterium]|nr:EAL domain-containing protein [Solirubrobacterales bacterium]
MAKGIENEDELNTVRGLGVAYGQGYFIARPAPIETMPRKFRQLHPGTNAVAVTSVTTFPFVIADRLYGKLPVPRTVPRGRYLHRRRAPQAAHHWTLAFPIRDCGLNPAAAQLKLALAMADTDQATPGREA